MLTAAETDALNSLFEEMLGHISDTGLREAMRHLLMAEGKRLRPALLLHTYKALGGTDTMRCIPAAAALEFTHTWTLIHDDIMDNSDTRRGISTVNKAYGNDAALLAGDGLFTLVTYTLVKTGDEPVKGREILKELMRATLMLIEGQYDDMTLSAREDVGEDSYIRMISKKTGALIEAPCVLGALMAERENDTRELCRNFGSAMGIAFQLKDDLLDLTGTEEFGKEIGKDIREGKKTLIVLHCLTNGKQEEAKLIQEALTAPSKASVEAVIHTLRQSGSLEYVQHRMEEYAQHAIGILDTFPEDTDPAKLRELTLFITEREK